MQTATTHNVPKKTPYGITKKEVFFALTSFIPGVMVIYFVLALFHVGGLRDSIVRGILMTIVLAFALFAGFWILYALFADIP
jgi:hypothetical protein